MTRGIVYIIGGGPGDPGLLTIRGKECLEKAETVVYDYLVNEDILGYAPADARRIYVGKKGGDHTVSQDELNRILVEEAREGRAVARLKGGDPFIFGRGGEEAQVLAAAGIPFEIVPGVSSAVAVPAYAGIPLTHRSHTSTVAFVTGHEDPSKEESRLDWEKLAGIETLVFLMGVKNLPFITKMLVEKGKNPRTPAALIRRGTTPDQETLAAALSDIAEVAKVRKFSPPAIFIVGDVVGLREELAWFEKKPLFGKTVVVTRPEEQAGPFAALLREKGANVIAIPVIRVTPVDDTGPLDEALSRIASYRWIIFTSANGVKFFFERMREKGMDVRDLKGIRMATIGPATAAAIGKMGLRVDLVPEEFISEGVVKAFDNFEIAGARILLPRAETARDVIPQGLAKRGAIVDVVPVYRTVGSGKDGSDLVRAMEDGDVDVVTFTSPSTVINFIAVIGGISKIPPSVAIACIGPVTQAAVEKAGLKADIMQGPYDMAGFAEAIEAYMKGK
ncbi:MAG: uroporphyrinogen-III C-methyltransferase [Syntrophales bacterium]|jgi:uroporphyrinogen III methyltransferase/synthase|nr:uroporphyrinogen-III C-methyltransferase [Syntrophales bacterium]